MYFLSGKSSHISGGASESKPTWFATKSIQKYWSYVAAATVLIKKLILPQYWEHIVSTQTKERSACLTPFWDHDPTKTKMDTVKVCITSYSFVHCIHILKHVTHSHLRSKGIPVLQIIMMLHSWPLLWNAVANCQHCSQCNIQKSHWEQCWQLVKIFQKLPFSFEAKCEATAQVCSL